MVGPGAVQPVIFYRAAELRGGASASPSPARRARKSFTRRGPDHTPFIRRSFQAAFILLNLWIGARFFVFVRYYESGGQTAFVSRPPGVEGWLPIAGLMNLKYAIQTWSVPDVHPAAMFLLVAFVAISFLLRKAFVAAVEGGPFGMDSHVRFSLAISEADCVNALKNVTSAIAGLQA